MKIKFSKLIPAVILLTVYSSVLGQEQQPKLIKRMSIHDIFIQIGSNSMPNIYATLIDFKTIVPQSVLLNRDLTDYSLSDDATTTNNSMFSVVLGIQFSDKQKKTYIANPLLRIGISYFSGTILNGSLYKEERKQYDTLTSSQTGHTYYFDSITSQSYNLVYFEYK